MTPRISALDEELDRIERGARQAATWPAQAGSGWVAEVSITVLDLVDEIRALRAHNAELERLAAGGDV
jgi:hypothetical protein